MSPNQVIRALLRYSVLIIAMPILAYFAMTWYSQTQIIPVYESTAKLYIIERKDSIAVNDLQVGQMISADYTTLLKSDRVLDWVKEKLQVEHTKDASIGGFAVTGSRVLNVTVRSSDPVWASAVANASAEGLIELAKEVTGVSNINLIDRAKPAKHPILPLTKRNASIAAAAGFLAMVILALITEALSKTVRTATDAFCVTGIAVLSAIPWLWKKKQPISTYYSKRNTYQKEMFKMLAQQIISQMGSGVLGVCSAIPKEGRSTVATLLAIALSKRKSVLLIGGQMEVRKYVPQKMMQDVKQSKIANLSYMGQYARTQKQQVSSEEYFQWLTTWGKENFDFVIIDMPAFALSEASEIATMLDSALIVMRSRRIRFDAARRTCERLKRFNIPIQGIVLNRAELIEVYQSRKQYHLAEKKGAWS